MNLGHFITRWGGSFISGWHLLITRTINAVLVIKLTNWVIKSGLLTLWLPCVISSYYKVRCLVSLHLHNLRTSKSFKWTFKSFCFQDTYMVVQWFYFNTFYNCGWTFCILRKEMRCVLYNNLLRPQVKS